MDDSKVAVLLEDIRSQMCALGEGLQILNEKVDIGFREINIRFEKVDARFDSLEHQNRQEHRLMMQMIKEIAR